MEGRNWCEFFTVHRTGVTSGKIHLQFLFMWQEIHQGKCETHVLLFTSISYERKLCLIYRCLCSASAVIRSWFIYELQKSTTIAFSRNSLYTFYSRNPTCGIPPCLRISNRKYPPCPEDSIIVNPPSPSEIIKAVHGIGMDIFWNHPMSTKKWDEN